jgi:hypothetical protein
MTELVAAPPPRWEEHTIRSRQECRQTPPLAWYAGVALAGFASIAASFAAGFEINLISRLRSSRVMI